MKLRGIHIFLTAILCVLIPIYQIGLLSLTILILFLVTLFQLNRNRKVEWLNIFLGGVGLFLVVFLSMLWTDNINVGWKNIETKLSLLLLPLIIGLSPPLQKKNFKFLSWSILVGVLISSLFLLGKACSVFFENSDFSEFSYAKLSAHFHPSYVSMYYAVALCFIFFYLENLKLKKAARIFIRALSILLLIMIALLASKSGIITCVAILVAALIRHFLGKQEGRSLYFLLFASVIFISAVFLNPKSKSRINSVITEQVASPNLEEEDRIKNSKKSSTQARLTIWSIAIDIISENFLIGEGAGDAKDVLLDKYKTNKEYYILSKKLNAHNQFLETGIATGLLGIMILSLMFGILILRAFRNKDTLMISILAVILLNLFTESMLERQSGAVFIALILSLLTFRDKGETVISS